MCVLAPSIVTRLAALPAVVAPPRPAIIMSPRSRPTSAAAAVPTEAATSADSSASLITGSGPLESEQAARATILAAVSVRTRERRDMESS